MSATVILDILSGMPNPQWDLAPEIAKQVCDYIIGSTPIASLQTDDTPSLGYRGLLIHLPECETAEPWLRIHNQIIENGSESFKDQNRYFERLLLNSAGDSVQKILLDHAWYELNK